MDTIFTINEDYTISLPTTLLNRLGYTSSQGSKEIFLAYVQKGYKNYVVISPSINLSRDFGHICSTKIIDGKLIFPKNFGVNLTPGYKLKLKKTFSSIPLWFEVF